MVLLSRTKSASDKAPAYLAVPSFIISPAVAASTNELMNTLRRTHTIASEKYQVKLDAIYDLKRTYEGYNEGGTTPKGIPGHVDTDFPAEMMKRHVAKQKAVNEIKAKNAKVTARIAEAEAEGNKIAVTMRRVAVLLDIVLKASRHPLIFDAAAILVSRTQDEQILYLNLLTKGVRFSFDNAEYESADVRVLDSLLRAGEAVTLV
jgi:hypothetical protein